jgi:hypothetical protein
LDHAAGAGIRDDLVTPGAAAKRLASIPIEDADFQTATQRKGYTHETFCR